MSGVSTEKRGRVTLQASRARVNRDSSDWVIEKGELGQPVGGKDSRNTYEKHEN